MIIWNGWGILVPLITIVGIVAGLIIAPIIGIPDYGIAIGLGLAAIANWLFWRKIHARPSKIFVDPQTGQQVAIKPTHSLFFIPARFWFIPITALTVLITLSISASNKYREKQAAIPGYTEFEAAHDLIATNSNGSTHGNTESAKTAAGAFTRMMKLVTSVIFTDEGGSNLMTGGEFLTYCQDGSDTIVFLCHVPSLRHYKTQETKSALDDIAWEAAKAAAEQINPEKTKTIMVGLRGITSYGSIQKGSLSDNFQPKALNTSERSVFYPAFAPATPSTVSP